MRRVNVILAEEDIDFLKKEAERDHKRGITAGIRKLIRDAKLPTRMEKDDPIFGIIGLFEGGGENVSEEHDKYIYTKDWERE